MEKIELGKLIRKALGVTTWRMGIGMKGYPRGFRVRPGSQSRPEWWVREDGISASELAAAESWYSAVWPDLRKEEIPRTQLIALEDEDED